MGEEEDNAIVLGIDIKKSFFDYILSIAFLTHRNEFPEIKLKIGKGNIRMLVFEFNGTQKKL